MSCLVIRKTVRHERITHPVLPHKSIYINNSGVFMNTIPIYCQNVSLGKIKYMVTVDSGSNMGTLVSPS